MRSAAFLVLASVLALGGPASAGVVMPPFHAEATTMALAPNDVGDHWCRSGYLLSVQATKQNDNANVAVVLMDRNRKSPTPGQWISVSGFKLAQPIHGQVNVTMICGA